MTDMHKPAPIARPHQGYTFKNAAAQQRLQRILELLEAAAHGMTRLELAAEANIHARHMKIYLAALRGEIEGMPRLIHVARWRRALGTGGSHAAVFAIGDKADAAWPRPISNAEKLRRYRAKKQAEARSAQTGERAPVFLTLNCAGGQATSAAALAHTGVLA